MCVSRRRAHRGPRPEGIIKRPGSRSSGAGTRPSAVRSAAVHQSARVSCSASAPGWPPVWWHPAPGWPPARGRSCRRDLGFGVDGPLQGRVELLLLLAVGGEVAPREGLLAGLDGGVRRPPAPPSTPPWRPCCPERTGCSPGVVGVAGVCPLLAESPALAPDSPPNNWFSASSRVGANPILSPNATRTRCSVG